VRLEVSIAFSSSITVPSVAGTAVPHPARAGSDARRRYFVMLATTRLRYSR